MKSLVHIVSVITVLSAPVISLVESDPAQSRALVRAELLKLERVATALVTVTALPVPSGSKPASRAHFRKAALSRRQAEAKKGGDAVGWSAQRIEVRPAPFLFGHAL